MEIMSHLLPRQTHESWRLASGAELDRLHQDGESLGTLLPATPNVLHVRQTPLSELRSRTQVGSWVTVGQSECAPMNSLTTRSPPDLCRSDRGGIDQDPGSSSSAPFASCVGPSAQLFLRYAQYLLAQVKTDISRNKHLKNPCRRHRT